MVIKKIELKGKPRLAPEIIPAEENILGVPIERLDFCDVRLEIEADWEDLFPPIPVKLLQEGDGKSEVCMTNGDEVCNSLEIYPNIIRGVFSKKDFPLRNNRKGWFQYLRFESRDGKTVKVEIRDKDCFNELSNSLPIEEQLHLPYQQMQQLMQQNFQNLLDLRDPDYLVSRLLHERDPAQRKIIHRLVEKLKE